jgi:hypothetical protein
MIVKGDGLQLDEQVLAWVDNVAEATKADIFLVDDEERNGDGSSKANSKEQLKFVIYGDMLTKENAKIRILVMVDQMVRLNLAPLTESLIDWCSCSECLSTVFSSTSHCTH